MFVLYLLQAPYTKTNSLCVQTHLAGNKDLSDSDSSKLQSADPISHKHTLWKSPSC